MKTIINLFAGFAAGTVALLFLTTAHANELTIYTFSDVPAGDVREHKPSVGVLVILSGHPPQMTNEKGEAVFKNVTASRSGKGHEISLYKTGCGKTKHDYVMPDSDARIGIRIRCDKRDPANPPRANKTPEKVAPSQY